MPDYLLCRITDEIMEDPVILESGFTYEKEQILKHFRFNGNVDPLTGEQVNPNVLITNKNIKQASQDFLIKNPWAYNHVFGEKLDSLLM